MNDITQFLTNHGGLILFAMVFAEQAGLPLPSAPWLLAAGALSASGKLSFAVAVLITALACVAADWIWFYIGRRRGARVLRVFCRVSLSPNSCVKRTKGLLSSHGLQALTLAKFIPVLGTVMPPLAGALGMSTARFLLFDGLGSAVYAGVYILAGFLFHNQLGRVAGLLNRLGLGALLLGLMLAGGYIVFKYIRRRGPLTAWAEHGHSRAMLPSVAAGPAVIHAAAGDPNLAELAEVNLALTGGRPQLEGEPASSSLLPPSPCTL